MGLFLSETFRLASTMLRRSYYRFLHTERWISNKYVYLGNFGEDSRPSNGTPVNSTPLRRSMGIWTSAAHLELSLSQASTRLCGTVPYRLVLLARNTLVRYYFEVAQSSKLITYCAVDFDTGSAEIFLFGPSCQSCHGHNIYDPSQSSTAKDLRQTGNLTYDGGNVVGNLFADTVSVGGFEVSAIG